MQEMLYHSLMNGIQIAQNDRKGVEIENMANLPTIEELVQNAMQEITINDIPLMEFADQGCCMTSGKKELHAHAKYVCDNISDYIELII